MKRKPSKNVTFTQGEFAGYSKISPSQKNPGALKMSANFNSDLGPLGFWLDNNMDNITDWYTDVVLKIGRKYSIAIKNNRSGNKVKREDGKWCGHADHIPVLIPQSKPTSTDTYHNLFDK